RLVQTAQTYAAETRLAFHLGERAVKFDHGLLRLDLGRHGARQGVEGRLADGGREAGGATPARQGLGQVAQSVDGLVLPLFGAAQGALDSRGDERRLFVSFHITRSVLNGRRVNPHTAGAAARRRTSERRLQLSGSRPLRRRRRRRPEGFRGARFLLRGTE